jgi:hypothetical protein
MNALEPAGLFATLLEIYIDFHQVLFGKELPELTKRYYEVKEILFILDNLIL